MNILDAAVGVCELIADMAWGVGEAVRTVIGTIEAAVDTAFPWVLWIGALTVVIKWVLS